MFICKTFIQDNITEKNNMTEQYNLVRTQNYFNHKTLEIYQNLVIVFLSYLTCPQLNFIS